MSMSNYYDRNARVGIAGSAPQMPISAPAPINPTQITQQQPPIGVAQNLTQGQPQGMPRPQPVGVGIAANQGAGQPGVANAMAQPSVGKIGMAQQPMTAAPKDFDIKGFASSMTKALGATNDKAQQMQQIQTNPGRPMDMQAYNAQVGGMQPMGSNAMKTIQGFQNQPIGGSMIGGQPNMQQLMQALRG
jgi:hypothetical protein